MLIFQAMVYCLVRPQADMPVLKRLESTLKKHKLLSSEPLKATEKQHRLRAELTNRVTVLEGECATRAYHAVVYPGCTGDDLLHIFVFRFHLLLPWSWNSYFQLHIMASHISSFTLDKYSNLPCPIERCLTQQTQHICITFIQCWTNVEDFGPTLYKCYTNVLCLLGRLSHYIILSPAVMQFLFKQG